MIPQSRSPRAGFATRGSWLLIAAGGFGLLLIFVLPRLAGDTRPPETRASLPEVQAAPPADHPAQVVELLAADAPDEPVVAVVETNTPTAQLASDPGAAALSAQALQTETQPKERWIHRGKPTGSPAKTNFKDALAQAKQESRQNLTPEQAAPASPAQERARAAKATKAGKKAFQERGHRGRARGGDGVDLKGKKRPKRG